MQDWYVARRQFERTEMLIGGAGMERLGKARVAVFGIGGVGGYVVEALARSGVGSLDLIDDDKVAWSNLNRQIIATVKTVGRYKVDVAKERILEINPEAEVVTHKVFYMPDTACQFDFSRYDYVVDAIDTVSGKLELVERAYRAGTRIISSMGAGNKMDAAAFLVADIYETSVCPLARVMRRELKKRGIPRLKVVYSQEKPLDPHQVEAASSSWYTGKEALPFSHSIEEMPSSHSIEEMPSSRPTEEMPMSHPKRQTPGSNAFVPSVVGLIIAGEVVRDLTGV